MNTGVSSFLFGYFFLAALRAAVRRAHADHRGKHRLQQYEA
jgi:hypothetical protein